MSTVECAYCRLPFKVRRVEPGRPYYCCTGCSLLARVPVDEKGNFPVNSSLVTLLTLGFLYFNQLLAWGVAFLLQREGRAALAERFTWIGAGAAVVVWGSVLLLLVRGGAARGKDYAFALFTLILVAAAFRDGIPALPLLAAANAIALIWNGRGLAKKRLSATNSPGS